MRRPIKGLRKRIAAHVLEAGRAAAVIWLAKRDVRTVFSQLDDPPKPNQRLKDAVKIFKATVRGQSQSARKGSRPGFI
jgi:hypothetical protein